MRQKRIRFAANVERQNIIEPGKELYEKIKGNWHQLYFENERPITVELGCGNGEYTTGLAQVLSARNFIGVDIKGDRLFKGSTFAMENALDNVGFLRTQIHQLDNFFETGEIDEFWLTFPDPRPRRSDDKRRLSHPRFLEMYRRLCSDTGWFRFKTDNTPLFEYTLEVLNTQFPVKHLEFTFDLYQSSYLDEHFGIQTKYEKIWTDKGEQIKYLKFQFDK